MLQLLSCVTESQRYPLYLFLIRINEISIFFCSPNLLWFHLKVTCQFILKGQWNCVYSVNDFKSILLKNYFMSWSKLKIFLIIFNLSGGKRWTMFQVHPMLAKGASRDKSSKKPQGRPPSKDKGKSKGK